jgi:hypothetical protein
MILMRPKRNSGIVLRVLLQSSLKIGCWGRFVEQAEEETRLRIGRAEMMPNEKTNEPTPESIYKNP